MIYPQPCKYCGADVLWLKHDRTHKPAPIDAAPAPNGNIRISRELGLYRIADEGDRKQGRELHLNHHATCPNVARVRADQRAKRGEAA
jgi:hypothetical protein